RVAAPGDVPCGPPACRAGRAGAELRAGRARSGELGGDARAPVRGEGGGVVRTRADSVLGDQSELIRHQAPTPLLVDPHADGTVLAARFLPAVFPLQCDTGSDDCRVSVDAHVLILARDRLDLGVTRPDVLEALLLGEESAVRVRERVVISPDVIQGRHIALRERFAVCTKAICERRGPAATGFLGRFLSKRDGKEYAAESCEQEKLPHGSPPAGQLGRDRKATRQTSSRWRLPCIRRGQRPRGRRPARRGAAPCGPPPPATTRTWRRSGPRRAAFRAPSSARSSPGGPPVPWSPSPRSPTRAPAPAGVGPRAAARATGGAP